MTGYGEDLSYIHDAGYAAAPTALLRFLPPRGFVVDLGCGSGVWARRLVDRGHQVLGIDQSKAMIRLARKTARGARFRVGSVYDAELPPCDAVTALGEVFNYRFRRGDLARLLRRIHQALRPGGVLAFDVAGPGRARGRHYRLENDWSCLVDSREQGSQLIRRITSFRRVGRLWRRQDEVHRLRLFRPSEVLAMLRKAGFRTRILASRVGLVTFLAITAGSNGRRAR